jgi:hypothetical protein
MTVAEFFSIYLNHNLINSIFQSNLMVGSNLIRKISLILLENAENATGIKHTLSKILSQPIS